MNGRNKNFARSISSSSFFNNDKSPKESKIEELIKIVEQNEESRRRCYVVVSPRKGLFDKCVKNSKHNPEKKSCCKIL